jgi:pSer/pThr/pTyr-binding forkhead associated (FHA) protein
MEDPVVGWLVVVKGPGRGQAVRIGAEWNSIGRDPDQRICLNFGDNHVSRRSHAKLNYEPMARKFSITIGDGINSTYVRGENLLGPTELKANDRIRIGETELMFVPLCGENFDWNNEQ